MLVVDMRTAETLHRDRGTGSSHLAERAGYADMQIVPIEHSIWRFYRHVP